jgi:RNA binding exosome subunit
MTNILQEAIKKVSALPEAAQERIGEELLLHVEKVHRLRVKLDKGIQSLERGEGRQLSSDDIIKRAHAQHGRG